jgi:hypothetical protein
MLRQAHYAVRNAQSINPSKNPISSNGTTMNIATRTMCRFDGTNVE